MSTTYDVTKDFNEFAVKKGSIMFDGETTASSFGCIGTLERSLDMKTITKQCEGITTKTKGKPTGTGTVKVSAHVPVGIARKLMNMVNTGLKPGVYGYSTSILKNFTFTSVVLNEDDEIMYQSYMNCGMTSMPTVKIDNAATSVAEVEFEFSFAKDTNGFPFYEAFETEIDDAIKTAWLTAFNSTLVKANS